VSTNLASGLLVLSMFELVWAFLGLRVLSGSRGKIEKALSKRRRSVLVGALIAAPALAVIVCGLVFWLSGAGFTLQNTGQALMLISVWEGALICLMEVLVPFGLGLQLPWAAIGGLLAGAGMGIYLAAMERYIQTFEPIGFLLPLLAAAAEIWFYWMLLRKVVEE